MKIKKLFAKTINDTRREKTIEVSLETDFGKFVSSSPNGKSKGEFERPIWKKSINNDILTVNKYFIEDINFKDFNDLHLIEEAFSEIVGGNTIIALEYCFLKALAFKENKEVWEVVSDSIKIKPKKMPYLIGNIIGGGAHSNWKGPTFQEFHIIPVSGIKRSIEILKRAHENSGEILKNIDKNFKGSLNDENAWQTNLGNEKVIEIIWDVKENILDEFGGTIHLGIDVAASEFFKDNNYIYQKEKRSESKNGQIKYMERLSKRFFYIEDPLEQNDFTGFSKILSISKGLIVGDDLIATSPDRLLEAIKKKSVNAIIIKPNQIGSLLEVKKIVEICRKNNIKMIFSHRSGETSEDIISDIAFGFGADFVKFGALGPGREEKLKRLRKIEEYM
ncbi:MAG: enolase C-terminal domain-like protein [Candidatus Pacearchaeota archaeon]